MSTTIESLIADLGNPDRLIWTKAVWSLKRLGMLAKPAIPALKLLLDDQSEPFLRLCAARVICKIEPDDNDAGSCSIQ